MSAMDAEQAQEAISGHILLISKGVPTSLKVKVMHASSTDSMFLIDRELEPGQEIGLMLFGIPAGQMDFNNSEIDRDLPINCKTRARIITVAQGPDTHNEYKVHVEFIGNLKIEGMDGTDFSRF